jgi:hypothetical protein
MAALAALSSPFPPFEERRYLGGVGLPWLGVCIMGSARNAENWVSEPLSEPPLALRADAARHTRLPDGLEQVAGRWARHG